MRHIRLALCDDHTLFRAGMTSLVNQISDVDLILEASNGQELIDQLPRKLPDVVLLDLQMPILDGLATTEYLRKHYPLIKIIILTMNDEDSMVLHLLEMGVSGYLLKNVDAAEVEKAIHKVMDDGIYLNDFVSKVMLRKMTRTTKVETPPTLHNSKIIISEREKEVLRLMCEGLSTHEIGDKLFLSPRTVEGHRLRLLEKTGTKNTAGVVAYAFRHNLV